MTMNYRPLGGTGIQVSAHCLGAMMFGAVGNPDHDDCARIIHAWGWVLRLNPDGTTTATSPDGRILRDHDPPRQAA